MTELEISFHGDNRCTIINKDWADFSLPFLQEATMDYWPLAGTFLLEAYRFDTFSFEALEKIKSILPGYKENVVTKSEDSIVLMWPDVKAMPAAQLAELCALYWSSYEYVGLFFLQDLDTTGREELSKLGKSSDKVLEKYNGYYVWHTGEEQNILSVAKSPGLEYPAWYYKISRSR